MENIKYFNRSYDEYMKIGWIKEFRTFKEVISHWRNTYEKVISEYVSDVPHYLAYDPERGLFLLMGERVAGVLQGASPTSDWVFGWGPPFDIHEFNDFSDDYIVPRLKSRAEHGEAKQRKLAKACLAKYTSDKQR